MITKIELVSCDDWYHLFINREEVSKGHRLTGDEVLDILSEKKIIEYIYTHFDGIDNPDMDSYLANMKPVIDEEKMVWEDHKAIK